MKTDCRFASPMGEGMTKTHVWCERHQSCRKLDKGCPCQFEEPPRFRFFHAVRQWLHSKFFC